MTVTARQLNQEDINLYEQMETQLDEDYMLRIFHRLVEGDNALFGLFEDDTLVAVSGYTIYAQEYAMLGRLRSDARYRKRGYGTKIVSYVLEQALTNPSIQWLCANTQRDNTPALSVLKKMQVPPVISLYAAQAEDVSSLTDGGKSWQEVTDLQRKKEWINQTYLNPSFGKKVFPFEAYYPFPVGPALFEEQLGSWRCFENEDQSRYMLMWTEEKGENYLHVVYPWNDFVKQPGFFDTIQSEFDKAKEAGEASLVWMDMTEDDAASLPKDHPFDLPSPWVLHAVSRETAEENLAINAMNEARTLMNQVEKELTDLDSIVGSEEDKLNDMLTKNEQLIRQLTEKKVD